MNGSKTFSQQVMLFTRQTAKRAASIASEELGQCIFACWMTIRRSSRWYRRTAMSAPRAGSRPAHVSRTRWRKAAFNVGAPKQHQ